MKKKGESVAIFAAICPLLFAVFTFAYSIDRSMEIGARVVYHGFPLQWLKATTSTLWIAPTEYTVLWLELAIDIIFTLAVSLAISYILVRSRRCEKKEEERKPMRTRLGLRVLLIVAVAYITKLISCGVHELLGHGFWAWVFGARSIQVYVSWLGFGWCTWVPPSEGIARVITVAGGLVNTFAIGTVILTFLWVTPKKGSTYARVFLFWLGFWATINQASYLLLGGITGYGDPGQLHYLAGIPLGFFTVLGFSLFLLVYIAASTLFLQEVSSLFPEYGIRALLFAFWLTMPTSVILFAISPEHALASEQFVLLLTASTLKRNDVETLQPIQPPKLETRKQ